MNEGMMTKEPRRFAIFKIIAVLALGTLMVASALLASFAPSDCLAGGTKTSTVTSLSHWEFATLDSEGDVGNDTSIVIDSNDKVHISYFDGTNGDLKYATNTGGSWMNCTLDSVGVVGKSTSIAVDSANRVHISYLDRTNADLKYATNAGGAWAYYTVDSQGNVGLFTSIALDSNNSVHIAYQDWTNYALKYATDEGGSWTNQTIDSSGDTGYSASIAVDSTDKIHISYTSWKNDDLMYATNAGGSWECYTVDAAGSVGFDTSIKVDSKDRVHISYSDDGNAVLKYATNAGGSWANCTLDDMNEVGVCTSIALDREDNVHISYLGYQDWSNSVLKYATNETGTWEYYFLEVVGQAGHGTSIAIDSDGLVHLGYKDSTNGDLRYAFGTERDLPSLEASFDATPASGQSPLTVQFRSNVSGGVEPYAYSWTFGDGVTNSSRDPIHTYPAAGTYTVTLVVTDLISTSISIHEAIDVSDGSVTPVPQDDRHELMLKFAVIPLIALALTAVVAAIALKKRKGRAVPGIRTYGTESAAASDRQPLEAIPQQLGPVYKAEVASRSPVPGEPYLTSVEQSLLKLKESRRKGLISEEEYDEKTRELLKRW